MYAPISIGCPGASCLNWYRSDPVKVSVLNKDNDGNRATANYSVDPVSSSASIEPSGTRHESLKAKQDNSVGIPVKRLRGPPSPDSKPVSTQPVST
jgi:hypothetical protein